MRSRAAVLLSSCNDPKYAKSANPNVNIARQSTIAAHTDRPCGVQVWSACVGRLTQQPELVHDCSLRYATDGTRRRAHGAVQHFTHKESYRLKPGGRRWRQYGRQERVQQGSECGGRGWQSGLCDVIDVLLLEGKEQRSELRLPAIWPGLYKCIIDSEQAVDAGRR